MKNKYMQRAGLAMALVLMATMIGPGNVVADNSIVAINREDMGPRVVEYSPMIKGLELDRVQLSIDYKNFNERMNGLEMIYDQLDAYQKLYNFYNSMSPNYQLWLGASAAVLGDPADASLALSVAEMTDGDYLAITDPLDLDFGNVADGPDTNTLTGTEELTLKAEIDSGMMMGVDVYSGFTLLRTQFATIGITDPDLSKEEEYDQFVYPIEIAPGAMQSGIFQMGLGIEQAVAGLTSGAESLYDAALMFEGFLSMQQMSYDMAVDSLQATTKKFELGQVSETTYKQAVNDEQIAKLQLDSMNRDVDNIKMNMNVMLGQEVLTPLVLLTVGDFTETLEPLDFYIERGMRERAEILTNDHNTARFNGDLSVYEDYLGKSSIEYIRGDNRMKDLALDKSYLMKEIEADIRNAYSAVIEQEKYFVLSKLTMEDSLRQKDEMQVYVELGFVTESAAKGLDILVTQSTNAYYKAYRDYLAALAALESASKIG